MKCRSEQASVPSAAELPSDGKSGSIRSFPDLAHHTPLQSVDIPSMEHPPIHKCFTTRLMDALFFSDAVYERTPQAVVDNLSTKLGRIYPLMAFGFNDDGHHQAVLIARSTTNHGSGHVVVACRGTSGVKDVLQDLKYLPTRLPFAKGAAHWGFAERAQSIPIDLICELLVAGEDVIFTGHSLGGAVASLLSLRVLESTHGCYQQQVQCITFGSPLFANWRLADFINIRYKDSFVHVISKKDFVPRVMPFLSTVQKLLYTSENHLKGLWILKKALECLHWLPIGALVTKLEQNIPFLIKFILKCAAKLTVSSELNGSFAFAGHIWILDACRETQCTLTLACADDLNMWHSQLNFGFGVRLTPSMLDNHAMSRYYEGVVLALSQALQLNDTAASANEVCEPKQFCGKYCGSFDSLLESGDTNRQINITKSCSISMSGIGTNMVSLCRHLPESNECHCLSTFEAGLEEAFQKCNRTQAPIDVANKKKKAKLAMLTGRSQALMKRLGCCAGVVNLFLPFTWERLSAGARLQEMQKVHVASKMVSSSIRESCSRPPVLRRLHSWSHSLLKPVMECETEQAFKRNRGSSILLHASTCEMQSVLTKSVLQSSPKRHLRIGWLIGSIGRVVRHLQALDNLCIFTIVSIFFNNLHG